MGLKFVQFSKNSSHHSGIKQSPYKALFRSDPRAGLRSTRLPTEVLERMVTENDLFAAIQQQPATSQLADDTQPATISASDEVISSHLSTSRPPYMLQASTSQDTNLPQSSVHPCVAQEKSGASQSADLVQSSTSQSVTEEQQQQTENEVLQERHDIISEQRKRARTS
jgi:TPP-dependent 2-oxoacid decarboxylase